MIEVTSITEKHDADGDTTSGDGITVSSINTCQIVCLTTPF